MKDKIKVMALKRSYAGNLFNVEGAYFKLSYSRSDWYSCAICRKDLTKKEPKYVYDGWHICVACAEAHEVVK